MVHCRDAIANSFVTKVWGEVFAHFHAVSINVTVVCGIDSLSCQDEFFVNRPLDIKETEELALDFAFYPSPFSVSASLYFLCKAHAFFLERLSNHCQGHHCTFFEICTKFDAVPLSDPS
jgi:hypothetical protein